MENTVHTEECNCNVCGAEYRIRYREEIVSGFPKYCAFCGEELDFELDDEFLKDSED